METLKMCTTSIIPSIHKQNTLNIIQLFCVQVWLLWIWSCHRLSFCFWNTIHFFHLALRMETKVSSMTCSPLAPSPGLVVPYAFWCSACSAHVGLLKPYSILPATGPLYMLSSLSWMFSFLSFLDHPLHPSDHNSNATFSKNASLISMTIHINSELSPSICQYTEPMLIISKQSLP